MSKILVCKSIQLYNIPKFYKKKILVHNFENKFSKNNKNEKIDGIIINPFTEFKKNFFKNIPQLKFVFIMGLHNICNINFHELDENVQVFWFDKKKIKQLKNVTPTPEFIIGLIFILSRRLNFFYKNKDKISKYSSFKSQMFHKKMISSSTLGILGYGRIGSQLANYALKLGMKVLVYAPGKKILNKKIKQIKKIDDLIKNSDFISNNASIKKNNYNFINKFFLKKMQKNSFLINTAKGHHLNIRDLLYFLEKRKIAGAAVDVYKNEDFSKIPEKKLLQNYIKNNDNLILTPHIAGSTIKDRSYMQGLMYSILKKNFY